MTTVESIINVVTYFSFYLYYVHQASLIAVFLLLLGFYILYRICTKDLRSIPYAVSTIPGRLLVWDRRSNVRARMHQYRELAMRPRVYKLLVPLIVAVAIAYILLAHLFFPAVVTSGSMAPTLEKYDVVLTQRLHLTPEVGDIIVFDVEESQLPVVHRIVSASSGGIKTKGDARTFQDGWVLKEDQINGELITYEGEPIVIKNVGRYILFDPSEEVVITSKYGSEFYRTAQIISYIKNMGLVIAIMCICLYLYFVVTERR
ncbi:MAG: signal peptidase I [Methanosarcinales archaeon]|nr:signal peptidase I [Methanosarcinales archaeon]